MQTMMSFDTALRHHQRKRWMWHCDNSDGHSLIISGSLYVVLHPAIIFATKAMDPVLFPGSHYQGARKRQCTRYHLGSPMSSIRNHFSVIELRLDIKWRMFCSFERFHCNDGGGSRHIWRQRGKSQSQSCFVETSLSFLFSQQESCFITV